MRNFALGVLVTCLFVVLIAASTNTAYFQSLNVGGGAFTVDDSGAVALSSPLDDSSVSDSITVGPGGSVDDAALNANVAHLNAAETITSNWVNTANPWADNEVSDTITVGSSGSVSDSALSANVTKLGSDIDLSGAEVTGTLPAASVGTGLTDAQVSDIITVGASGSVDDSALSANVTKLGSQIDLGGSEVAGTLPAAKVGTGLTDAQVSNTLTIGSTSNMTSPPTIGATTPNTGRFTTLSATGNIYSFGSALQLEGTSGFDINGESSGTFRVRQVSENPLQVTSVGDVDIQIDTNSGGGDEFRILSGSGGTEILSATTSSIEITADLLPSIADTYDIGGSGSVFAQGHFSSIYTSTAEVTTHFRAKGPVSLGTASEPTISGGSIAYTKAYMQIGPEGSSTDDLTNITGGAEGDRLILQADLGTTITLKHNSGSGTANILCSGQGDLTMNGAGGSAQWLDVIWLIHNGNSWIATKISTL